MKRKEKRGILKRIFLAITLGILIIVFGGTFVGVGVRTWSNYDFYSFISDIVGTVHENYPEIEGRVINNLKDRDSLSIKLGNDILYEKGYDQHEFEKRHIGRNIIVGILGLIFVAMAVALLLFWQWVPHMKKDYIWNTQVLMGVGIALIVILVSGIKIGEILNDWNFGRYHIVVGEITGTLANEDRQKGKGGQTSQDTEKFVRVALDLEHTNKGYDVLKQYGYGYRDFKYEGEIVTTILAGMMAVTPLAVYFILLYLYMQKRIINIDNSGD